MIFKCPECNEYETQNLDSLRIHYSKKHKLTARELYLKLFKNGQEPTCACGCGKVPKFITLQKGFSEFILGHYSRIHNNWGHNKEALQKSQDVRRQQIIDGTWIPWNKGETKESDSRVAAYGKSGKETINNSPSECEARSKRMTKNRLNGTVPTLFGSDHPNWRGGASALQRICRSRLHHAWVYPKMKASGFKCTKCNTPGPGLCVHHDQEWFSDILQKAIKTLGEPGDDFEKKSSIADWVTAYHVENDVSGIVLCESCHAKEHAK